MSKTKLSKHEQQLLAKGMADLAAGRIRSLDDIERDLSHPTVPAGEAATPVPTPVPTMTDAAEMLWVVLANVSGGDWSKQSVEWQEAAMRWRDYYFAALRAERVTPQATTMRERATNFIEHWSGGVIDAMVAFVEAERITPEAAIPKEYTAERHCCTICDAKKVCHLCGAPTLMACSDCAINFGATIYVCGKRECRVEHERRCFTPKATLVERVTPQAALSHEIDICLQCRNGEHEKCYGGHYCKCTHPQAVPTEPATNVTVSSVTRSANTLRAVAPQAPALSAEEIAEGKFPRGDDDVAYHNNRRARVQCVAALTEYASQQAARPVTPAAPEPTDADEPLCMQEVAAVAYQCLGAAQAPVRVMDYFSAIAQGEDDPPNPLPVLDTEFGHWQSVASPTPPAETEPLPFVETDWTPEQLADFRKLSQEPQPEPTSDLRRIMCSTPPAEVSEIARRAEELCLKHGAVHAEWTDTGLIPVADASAVAAITEALNTQAARKTERTWKQVKAEDLAAAESRATSIAAEVDRFRKAYNSAAEQRDVLKARVDDLRNRLGKPRCLDCNAAGIGNCSHFDNCAGVWKYELEDRAHSLAATLTQVRETLENVMVYIQHLPDCTAKITGQCTCGMVPEKRAAKNSLLAALPPEKKNNSPETGGQSNG